MFKLNKIISSKSIGFDISKYPYCSYLIAHYVHNMGRENIDLDKLVAFIAKQNKQKGFIVPSKFEKELKESFKLALMDIRKEVSKYDFFKDIFKSFNISVA